VLFHRKLSKLSFAKTTVRHESKLGQSSVIGTNAQSVRHVTRFQDIVNGIAKLSSKTPGPKSACGTDAKNVKSVTMCLRLRLRLRLRLHHLDVKVGANLTQNHGYRNAVGASLLETAMVAMIVARRGLRLRRTSFLMPSQFHMRTGSARKFARVGQSW
jgi:hypothetical protein